MNGSGMNGSACGGPIMAVDGAVGQRWLAIRRPYLAEMMPLESRATAYLCENFSCQAPVRDAAGLRALLG